MICWEMLKKKHIYTDIANSDTKKQLFINYYGSDQVNYVYHNYTVMMVILIDLLNNIYTYVSKTKRSAIGEQP